MTEKKLPQRSCVACRKSGDKANLLRMVRTPEGQVLPDPGGKLKGRGAYVCPGTECLSRALQKGSLARSLRVTIEAHQRDEIIRRVKAYEEGNP